VIEIQDTDKESLLEELHSKREETVKLLGATADLCCLADKIHHQVVCELLLINDQIREAEKT
jgi:hypothetical protein